MTCICQRGSRWSGVTAAGLFAVLSRTTLKRFAMPMPQISEAVTHGIRVGASAFFLPEESDPTAGQFVFGYRITISNEGERSARLLSRRWLIIDANGQQEQVEGPGVVGETPLLEPGQSFKYTSYCPLTTPWGTMEGTYEFEDGEGRRFEARIARFYLAAPRELTAK